MADRWIGVLWAATAAAILGVLVAAATGGSSPSSALLLALVVVPSAITLIVRTQRLRPRTRPPESDYSYRSETAESGTRSDRKRRSVRGGGPDRRSERESRSQYTGAQFTAGANHEQSVPLGNEDWEVIRAICGALDSRDLDWLRRNDFVTPWLDGRARRVIELEPLVAFVVNRPFAWDIRSALERLSDTVEPFAAYYDANTFPDPLLLGEDWRFFEQDDSTIVEQHATGDDLWDGGAIELHRLAAPIADAYESFVLVTTRDSTIRRRVGVPV